MAGKKALVTGGGRGIGREIALAFARQGADVAVNYRGNAAAALDVVEEISAMGRRAVALQADVAVREQCRSLVESAAAALGGVNVLVNNAGLSKPSLLLSMSEQDWQAVIAVHLGGTFHCTQAAAEHMKAAGSGRVINVISTAGTFGTIGQINYASAKAGVIGFTKSASRELGRYGITVNAVCPGVTETDMTENLRGNQKLAEKYLGRIQLGRFARAAEIAPAFVFLASDEASYVTGHVLHVDGGYVG